MFDRYRIRKTERKARRIMRRASYEQAAAIMQALASSHVPHTRAVAAIAAERAEETATTRAAADRARRYRDALAAGHRVKVSTFPAVVRTGEDPLSLSQVADIESALLNAFEDEENEDD